VRAVFLSRPTIAGRRCRILRRAYVGDCESEHLVARVAITLKSGWTYVDDRAVRPGQDQSVGNKVDDLSRDELVDSHVGFAPALLIRMTTSGLGFIHSAVGLGEGSRDIHARSEDS